MKMISKILIFSSVVAVSACGEYREGGTNGSGGGSTSISGGALIQTQVKTTYFIDGTTKSCLARETQSSTSEVIVPDDVSPFYFRLAGVRIPPAPAGFRYKISSIRITLEGQLANSGRCTISSDALTTLVKLGSPDPSSDDSSSNAFAFIEAWRSDALGNVIPGADEVAALPADKQFLSFDCPITCGGISIPDSLQRTQFSVPARLEAVGSLYPIGDPFAERPFRSETSFTIENF